jgi:alkylated DNA repair dioxygenase AlkB
METYDEIPGLYVFPDLQPCEEITKWFYNTYTQNSLVPINYRGSKRKVIHYGFIYDYHTRNIYKETTLLPDIIKNLRDSIPDTVLPTGRTSSEYFNQCIINRYVPGEGISAHTDFKDFGDVIACFTFGDTRYMQFSLSGEKYDIETRPGDLYVMTGDSRWKWKHCMPPHTGDETVFSVTFRNVSK